jgi:hypothetical protein
MISSLRHEKGFGLDSVSSLGFGVARFFLFEARNSMLPYLLLELCHCRSFVTPQSDGED